MSESATHKEERISMAVQALKHFIECDGAKDVKFVKQVLQDAIEYHQAVSAFQVLSAFVVDTWE